MIARLMKTFELKSQGRKSASWAYHRLLDSDETCCFQGQIYSVILDQEAVTCTGTLKYRKDCPISTGGPPLSEPHGVCFTV